MKVVEGSTVDHLIGMWNHRYGFATVACTDEKVGIEELDEKAVEDVTACKKCLDVVPDHLVRDELVEDADDESNDGGE